MLHRVTGAFGKAEPLCERALKLWESALGPDCGPILPSLSILAEVHRAKGDLAGAERLLLRALGVAEEVSAWRRGPIAILGMSLGDVYVDRLGVFQSAGLPHGVGGVQPPRGSPGDFFGPAA